MKIWHILSLGFYLITGPLLAETTFSLTDLPEGKSVTLPRPALTAVPLGASVNISSTDLPQTVKMYGQASNGATVQPFQVAIYEEGKKKARIVKIDGKHPVLYNFKSLTSITLRVVAPKKASAKTNLVLESSKPMSLSR